MKQVYYSKISIVSINSDCTNKPEKLPNEREIYSQLLRYSAEKAR